MMLDARCSMLNPRCSIFDAGKGFSIQDRASRIEHPGSRIEVVSLCLKS
ncbi:MAG: hypothetical protein AB1797_13350 [bacterium]